MRYYAVLGTNVIFLPRLMLAQFQTSGVDGSGNPRHVVQNQNDKKAGTIRGPAHIFACLSDYLALGARMTMPMSKLGKPIMLMIQNGAWLKK